MYFRFYVGFGLRPADVGLSRVTLLQESVIGPVLIPLWRADEHKLTILVVVVLVMAASALIARALSGPRVLSYRELLAEGLISSW